MPQALLGTASPQQRTQSCTIQTGAPLQALQLQHLLGEGIFQSSLNRRDGFTGTERECSKQLFSRACSAPPGAGKDEDISCLLLPNPDFHLTCHLKVKFEVTLQFLSPLSPCWLQS